MNDDDGLQPPPRPRLRYRPPRGLWVTAPWQVWLPLAALLVGLPVIAGAYISAVALFFIVAVVAYLRVRDRAIEQGRGWRRP
jgi:hypothetical protein